MSEHREHVQLAIDLLCEAGYQLLELPLRVASVPFEFTAVLCGGSGKALDLVIEVDMIEEKPTRVHQKIDGLARALDMMQSQRSVTAVLVGPPPPITSLR